MLTLRKKIIVAIDGSPQSDKAAEEAVRLASVSGTKFKSRLYAVMVLPSMKTPSFTDFFPDKPADEMPGWQDKRDRLFYVVEKVAKEMEVQLESLVVYGDPAEELMLMAEEKNCDVIVVGSSGKGRVKRTLLGSVSTKISLQAHCSVYIVR
jgi:nucleotide-binding universal stress UspA family protein